MILPENVFFEFGGGGANASLRPAVSYAYTVCVVSDGVRKHGPSAAFFSDLENRCTNLRRLHLSNADINSPLPASVEVLTLSQCSLSPLGFPPSRFDAASQTVTSPRLRKLELLSVELQRGALAAVPASVEKLRIKNTGVSHESLEGVTYAAVPQLAEIDLSDSTTLTDIELYHIISAWPSITTLKMNGCVNTTFPQISVFTQIFENLNRAGRLEVFEAAGVPFMPSSMTWVCSYLYSLRRLSIVGCPLNKQSVARIVTDLPYLQSLDVSGCQQLNDAFFLVFAGLRDTLRFLNVWSTNIADHTVHMLRLSMPHCEIVH